MEKMILILNVFNHNAKWRTKERDLQLGQGRRRAKLEYCLPFKHVALGLLGPRGTRKFVNTQNDSTA